MGATGTTGAGATGGAMGVVGSGAGASGEPLLMGGKIPGTATPPSAPGAGATGEPKSAGGVIGGKIGSGAYFASDFCSGLHPAIMMPPKTTAWMPTKTATMTGRLVFRLAFCSKREPCGFN